jgi:hypothetical protein
MILDEDLSIERKMVEILSKIIYLDLSLDAMGFNHPSDGQKIFLHEPSLRFLKKSRNL